MKSGSIKIIVGKIGTIDRQRTRKLEAMIDDGGWN